MRDHQYRVLSLFLALVIGGCQSREEAVVPAPAVESTPGTSAESPKAEENSNGPDLAEDGAETQTVAEFTPPFPNRLELFEPPKHAQGTARRSEEHGETVELKGFINVDQPKVVLSIDGVISPVAQGSEKYGVQVIAIQPPNVVLQRGRDRWTATLE